MTLGSGDHATFAGPPNHEKDLRDIFVQMARLNAKVDSALAVRPAVDRFEGRLVALELRIARQDGGWSIGRQVFDVLMAVGMALVAAGVWIG